jgi:hypothetical protein
MREIRQSGSEGGAGQTNVPFLPLSSVGALPRGLWKRSGVSAQTNFPSPPPRPRLLCTRAERIFYWSR